MSGFLRCRSKSLELFTRPTSPSIAQRWQCRAATYSTATHGVNEALRLVFVVNCLRVGLEHHAKCRTAVLLSYLPCSCPVVCRRIPYQLATFTRIFACILATYLAINRRRCCGYLGLHGSGMGWVGCALECLGRIALGLVLGVLGLVCGCSLSCRWCRCV